MDSGVETLDGPGVIRYGKPDRHQDFRPYVIGKVKDGLDHLLGPTRDLAYSDPECGSSNSNVAGRRAGVEPCDDLNSSGPHDFRSLVEVAADNDGRRCVVHETRTGMPHRPYQPRVGDDNKMPDTRAGYLSSAGRVDNSIKDIGVRKFGSEDAVHPAKTHGFEHGFCRAATRIGYAFGHRALCYNHRTSCQPALSCPRPGNSPECPVRQVEKGDAVVFRPERFSGAFISGRVASRGVIRSDPPGGKSLP